MTALSIVYQRVGELKQYEKNSRTHSAEQIKQIERSINEFGFTNPILVDENSEIIAGHGRLEAAKNLKLEMVPTITLEGLTQEQKKAYVIADNQLSLNAGWDFSILSEELNMLDDIGFDISLLGFGENELANLMDLSPNFDPATEDDQGKLDELDPKWVDCPHCGKEFDLRQHA